LPSITVLTPTGTLGYGFGIEAFKRGMALRPDVIAVDAGSTDPGAYYLGSGKPLVSRYSTKYELTTLILAACSSQIPLIVGSAGGAGTKSHVDWTAQIVREIATENNLKFNLATIYADVSVERARKAVKQREIQRFEASFALTSEVLDETVSLVAQMGHEPIVEALRQGAQVIIAGRAVDDCAIAAFPIWRGADPAQSIHMGKVLECGAFSAEPFAMDVMIGVVNGSDFILEPGSLDRRASLESVAAHSLYERENPYIQVGPGHNLDLHQCAYEQVGQRSVRVSGAIYEENPEYWVKIEGARIAGYRTIFIGGIRCPTMIGNINEILEQVRQNTISYFKPNDIQIEYHVYGRDGVMRGLEPQKTITSHELGLVIEVLASNQEMAHGACHHISGTLLHEQWDGQFNTSGNIAVPFSPSEIDSGPVYVFSAYHLMKTEGAMELFPINFEEV